MQMRMTPSQKNVQANQGNDKREMPFENAEQNKTPKRTNPRLLRIAKTAIRMKTMQEQKPAKSPKSAMATNVAMIGEGIINEWTTSHERITHEMINVAMINVAKTNAAMTNKVKSEVIEETMIGAMIGAIWF